jgi:ABC-type phosphate transport system auxiliary subunit
MDRETDGSVWDWIPRARDGSKAWLPPGSSPWVWLAAVAAALAFVFLIGSLVRWFT